jgi:hypothetical protein
MIHLDLEQRGGCSGMGAKSSTEFSAVWAYTPTFGFSGDTTRAKCSDLRTSEPRIANINSDILISEQVSKRSEFRRRDNFCTHAKK